MTPAEAKTYITAHDRRVRQLDKLTVLRLNDLYRQTLAASGSFLIHGGPVSRPEFISAIIEIEFPAVSQAREIYVQAQDDMNRAARIVQAGRKR